MQLRKAREDARLNARSAVSMPPTDCAGGMMPLLLCEASGLQILQLIVLVRYRPVDLCSFVLFYSGAYYVMCDYGKV